MSDPRRSTGGRGKGEAALPNPLIAAMLMPGFYPHPCESVELRHSLRSWLLFAGDRVYKIKKPVRFFFIDATTPARRLALCRDEIELNRRLAPEIYLGVQGVVATQNTYALTTELAASEVTDFAIVMRRLPAERMLDRLLSKDAVNLTDVKLLASHLAAFHACATTAKAQRWGSAQALYGLVGSLEEAQKLVADSLMRARLKQLQAHLRRYIISHRQSLDNRVRDGRVREGHGDLRCKSVCLTGDKIVIINCADCSESRRYLDVAGDLASLIIDLELPKRSDLAQGLLEAYVLNTGDHQVPELMKFYKCFQATWRGILQMLTSLRPELPNIQRIAARGEARQWLDLALEYAA